MSVDCNTVTEYDWRMNGMEMCIWKITTTICSGDGVYTETIIKEKLFCFPF